MIERILYTLCSNANFSPRVIYPKLTIACIPFKTIINDFTTPIILYCLRIPSDIDPEWCNLALVYDRRSHLFWNVIRYYKGQT